jgi:hypothetical protein
LAITDAYATNATYKAVIGKSTGDDDSQIDAQCLAISRYIDRKLNRFFTRDDAVTTRIYYPLGYYSGNPEAENPWIGIPRARDLDVDDISTSTGLVIKIDTDRDGDFSDETALLVTDYELHPLNADKGPEPKPWNQIHLPAWSTRQGWPTGSPIQVTARFGWPAVPQAIVQATCQLVAILRIEGPRATSQISAGFDTVLGASSEAQDIVKQLQAVYDRRLVFA